MREMISFSGGKDSVATVLLHHKLGRPPCRVVYACLYFDLAAGIPAARPVQLEWIKSVAFPRFEKWGYKCEVVPSPPGRDLVSYFRKVIVRHFEGRIDRRGKRWGFPCGGGCYFSVAKRSLLRSCEKDCDVSWIGLAADEAKRLEAMRPPCDSLLAREGMTEAEAWEWAKAEGLLSPIYDGRSRDGCWFCPNAPIRELANLVNEYPEYWRALRALREEYSADELATAVIRHTGRANYKTWEEQVAAIERLAAEEASQLALF